MRVISHLYIQLYNISSIPCQSSSGCSLLFGTKSVWDTPIYIRKASSDGQGIRGVALLFLLYSMYKQSHSFSHHLPYATLLCEMGNRQMPICSPTHHLSAFDSSVVLSALYHSSLLIRKGKGKTGQDIFKKYQIIQSEIVSLLMKSNFTHVIFRLQIA